MRKFLLYFLLMLLTAAVGTFSYGLLNGGKIRNFAAQVSQIQARHNLAPQIEKIEASFRDNSKKEISQIRDESRQFSVQLEEIESEAEAVQKEIGDLDSPSLAGNMKKMAEDYYSKLAREAADLKGIVDYMSQIIEVAAVFGEMQENSSLEEMKNLIARAKEKENLVQTEALPQGVKTEAQNLKEAMSAFLSRMEEMAALKSENTADLDASYENFSQKEDEFFAAAKKYIDGMEDLGTIEKKINSDLERLNKIKFSLR